MTAASAVAVESWVWRASDLAGTVVAAVVTLALCTVLVWHLLLVARASPRGEAESGGAPETPAPASAAGGVPLRRRLVRASVYLGGWFVIVVLARFAIILMERPGP